MNNHPSTAPPRHRDGVDHRLCALMGSPKLYIVIPGLCCSLVCHQTSNVLVFSSKYSLRQSEGIRQVPAVFDWRQAVLAQPFDSDISLRREGYFPSALIEIQSRELKSNQK